MPTSVVVAVGGAVVSGWVTALTVPVIGAIAGAITASTLEKRRK